MATIKGEVPKELEEEFRKIIAQKYGLKKGNISLALKKAIEEWIANQKRILALNAEDNSEFVEKIRKNYPDQFVAVDDSLNIIGTAKTVNELYNEIDLTEETRIIVPKKIFLSDSQGKRQLGWNLRRREVVS